MRQNTQGTFGNLGGSGDPPSLLIRKFTARDSNFRLIFGAYLLTVITDPISGSMDVQTNTFSARHSNVHIPILFHIHHVTSLLSRVCVGSDEDGIEEACVKDGEDGASLGGFGEFKILGA